MAKEPKVLKDHNGGISSETIARAIRELTQLESLEADVKAKKASIFKRIKDDGLDPKDVKEGLAEARLDPQVVIDRRNRITRILKVANPEIGERLGYIDDYDSSAKLTDEEMNRRWFNEGRTAGIQGANRDTCPHDPNSAAGRAWGEGYQEAQNELLGKITDGKGNAAKPPKPEKAARRRGKGAPANDPDPAPAGGEDTTGEAGEEAGGEADENAAPDGDDAPPVPPGARVAEVV